MHFLLQVEIGSDLESSGISCVLLTDTIFIGMD